MSSNADAAIKVKSLGKCYQIYDHPQDRLKQSIVPRIRSLMGREAGCYYREFWALQDVSFDVWRGETVGIIGRNGSGKSTLLQIICGTLAPTTGSVETQGRVAALLELGAGFNPEFTGRENVYMNAAVLGLSRTEVDSRFDSIAEFADIGSFIDQPVKHYSSGMYARLAFSVAISVEPDILVVDEALAVGDEPFQRKCFVRMNEIKERGGTILFVSHSGGAVINLCDRALLLHKGRRLFTGLPKKAVFYNQKLGSSLDKDPLQLLSEIREADTGAAVTVISDESETAGDGDDEKNIHSTDKVLDKTETAFFDKSLISKSMLSYEENGASLRSPRLLSSEGYSVNQITTGHPYELVCDVEFYDDCMGVRFYALIRTTAGIDLAGCAYPPLDEMGIDCNAGSKLVLKFKFDCQLNPGTYFCNFAVQGGSGQLHHRIVDAIAFRVGDNTTKSATGLVDLGFVATVQECGPFPE